MSGVGESEHAAVDRRGVHPNAPPFISVVVVNFNGRHYLEGCLRALAAQARPTFEVLLVDNASTDGSADWVAAHFPDVHVLRAPRNLGFAAGNNLGIRAARGDLIATLNNDTEVEPDYLEQLSAPMREARVGMCAPLMLEFRRRDRIDSAGIGIDRAGFAWNLKAGKRADRAMAERTVFGACAGAALYRRALLDDIGLFDEEYFGFYEDADLAWRAQLTGWKCVLVPGARVYHVHGGSFRQGSAQKLYLLARNRWWTVLKDYPMPALALNLPLILAADLLALLSALVRYRSLSSLRGRVDALRGLRGALAKRRAFRTLDGQIHSPRGNVKPTSVG
jgi:GT2 family glycosyltransferase